MSLAGDVTIVDPWMAVLEAGPGSVVPDVRRRPQHVSVEEKGSGKEEHVADSLATWSPPAWDGVERKLTIGMATYDDFDGVYFTVQAILLYHPEVADDVEVLVIDNNPEGSCGPPLRKLARQIFHGMNVHQARLQHKQGFLFRVVDIANELFAMAATVSRAHALAKAGDANAREAAELADLFCRGSRRKVKSLFRALWRNDDTRKYRAGVKVMQGGHAWFETGVLTLDEATRTGKAEAVGAESVPEPSEIGEREPETVGV